MKKIFTTLLITFTASTISFTQNGRYDVRLEGKDCNCCTEQLFVDLQVRASSTDSTFRLSDQSYLFSYNPEAIDSVAIANEGMVSGFIVPNDGGNLGFSVYASHELTVTPNEIAYNIDFLGGDGLLIETDWVHVGTLVFSISDIYAPFGFDWLTQSDTPPTVISEVIGTDAVMLTEGLYINDVSLNTFANCACVLGYGAALLSTQQEVDNFATNYPGLELGVSLIIAPYGNNTTTNIVDLTPLSVINSLNRLTITDNAALTSLEGLENVISIACVLRIEDNAQLATCNIPAICNYLENGETANINNNAAGCNSELEVIQGCFLSVEMSAPLRARLQDQTAVLTWRTETETNNAGFEIQKSTDGIQWQRIGWQAGQGSTSTPHTYMYADENPFSNTSYYRLKQVDFDGKFTYSNIASLEYIRPQVNVYPNPATDKLYINTDNQTIDHVLIFDTMGKQINAQITDNTIDVALLPKGLYTIKVIMDGQYFYEKIVVE